MEQKNIKRRWIGIGIVIVLFVLATIAFIYWIAARSLAEKKPEEVLQEYMGYVEKQDYDAMYELVEAESIESLGKEPYIERNSAIYEGIEASNIVLTDVKAGEKQGKAVNVIYTTTMDTVAGELTFENQAELRKTKEGYRIVWEDGIIFPGLDEEDRISVSDTPAERGKILDRNGYMLAGKGVAASVGIVPGKLEDQDASIQKLAELLGMDGESIKKKLEASWVKEDSFVPIKTIPKVLETDLMAMEPDEAVQQAKAQQDQILEIAGVMIQDEEVRTYPLNEAAAHLIGYVQSVTAEDLEEHAGEGYTANSVIGKSGLEAIYEEELRGQDGYEIRIVDQDGEIEKSLAKTVKQDGQDIQLTIDAALQQDLYTQFSTDKSCSVAMNPYTGEVLALVSTPSFDGNDFIMGLSDTQWKSLNESPDTPLNNRFLQVWCPGSTFKPVTAAIGLQTGTLDSNQDFGNVGLSWQKDSSWGDYYVTTLQAYEPVIMENALIYSDNIYFAKAALQIGADKLESSLDQIGFGENIPFEIGLSVSQYANEDHIEGEIQLADSGYGQGQILVNPVHLASIYTSFLNQGNMLKPRLIYEEGAGTETWISQAFSSEVSEQVLEGMKKVVNAPGGTGYAAHREDVVLAGKTGTAEIKASVEDTSGTELGWFAVTTTDPSGATPILLISMVEDVKAIGGSGYVVGKDSLVLEHYVK